MRHGGDGKWMLRRQHINIVETPSVEIENASDRCCDTESTQMIFPTIETRMQNLQTQYAGFLRETEVEY